MTQGDTGRQTLFFIGLSLLCLIWAAFAAHAQGQAPAPEKTPLSYLQYHQEAEKIDEKAHTVSLDKFLELRKQKGTVVVDLRSPEQYAQSHVEGAVQFGADISKEKLEKLIPSKDTTVLLYCEYSLMPVRMIALTNVSLPQFILHGYKNTYKLAPIWRGSSNWQDTGKEMARLPMTKSEGK